MSEELLPCPFCGGPAQIVSGGPGCHFVRCGWCTASTDDGSREQAIAAWNRRADERPPYQPNKGDRPETVKMPAIQPIEAKEYDYEVLKLGEEMSHEVAVSMGYPSVTEALERLAELREAQPTAEAVREAYAKVAESTSLRGVLTPGWADGASSARSQIAVAIRAMPLPQAEAAKVEPVAWMYTKANVYVVHKTRWLEAPRNGWTETPLIPAPKGQSDE